MPRLTSSQYVHTQYGAILPTQTTMAILRYSTLVWYDPNVFEFMPRFSITISIVITHTTFGIGTSWHHRGIIVVQNTRMITFNGQTRMSRNNQACLLARMIKTDWLSISLSQHDDLVVPTKHTCFWIAYSIHNLFFKQKRRGKSKSQNLLLRWSWRILTLSQNWKKK